MPKVPPTHCFTPVAFESLGAVGFTVSAATILAKEFKEVH